MSILRDAGKLGASATNRSDSSLREGLGAQPADVICTSEIEITCQTCPVGPDEAASSTLKQGLDNTPIPKFRSISMPTQAPLGPGHGRAPLMLNASGGEAACAARRLSTS